MEQAFPYRNPSTPSVYRLHLLLSNAKQGQTLMPKRLSQPLWSLASPRRFQVYRLLAPLPRGHTVSVGGRLRLSQHVASPAPLSRRLRRLWRTPGPPFHAVRLRSLPSVAKLPLIFCAESSCPTLRRKGGHSWPSYSRGCSRSLPSVAKGIASLHSLAQGL